jgi:hypothetical protein
MIIRKLGRILGMAAFVALLIVPEVGAETRNDEFRFQLSNDFGSEFSAQLKVIAPGPLRIEAEWKPLNAVSSSTPVPHTRLTLILLRADGTEAARTSGTSPLRLEMRVFDQDIGRSSDRARPAWTVKILNTALEHRREVTGVLRTVIPSFAGILAESEFVLLGSGNAKEIDFLVSGSGRLVLETDWQTNTDGTEASSLSLSLLHFGEDRIYARRRGRSPLRIEQPIADPVLANGARFIVRIQNESPVRVRGRVKVTFVPR